MTPLLLVFFGGFFILLLSGFWVTSPALFFVLWLFFNGWIGLIFYAASSGADFLSTLLNFMFFALANIYFFAFLSGNFLLKKSVLNGLVVSSEVNDFFKENNIHGGWPKRAYEILWVIVYVYSPVCLILGFILGKRI